MGRHKKVIPKFKADVFIQTLDGTQLKRVYCGNLITAPYTLPGSPDDFIKAFQTWIREYSKGPKRIRKKPATKILSLEN